MNPFEQMQSLADLWGKSGKAFVTAQQGLFSGMADTMAKAVGSGDKASFQAFAPDTQGFEAARQDFSKLWASASELSSALTQNLQGADQANPLMAEMLAKIFDPRGWFSATNEVDQTLQRMIPPATTQALKLCVGSNDYQELPLPGGHVGVFVGGKSQGLLGSGIANWLAERDREAAPTHAAH